MNRELSRRSKSTVSLSISSNTIIKSNVRDSIRASLISMSMPSNTTNNIALASEMTTYINYIKTLYDKKLKS